MSIRVSHEAARGCGFRKTGGLYLVAPRPSEPCSLLPVETAVCPCCGVGIKPARGFTWWDADPFLDAHYDKHYERAADDERKILGIERPHDSVEHSNVCPFARTLGRVGLIWIGEAFYKTPHDFMDEARQMGISRRISAVPRDFKVGETWVLLAHRKAVAKGFKLRGDATVYETIDDLRLHEGEVDAKEIEEAFMPGVITAFKPTAIEYVVRPEDEEDEEFLDTLRERGIEPVKVIPIKAEEPLPLGAED